MKRRWRLLVCLLLLLVAVGSLSHPAVHWRLIGWCRGEAFYQGRPTSWWATECRQWELRPVQDGSDLILSDWVRQPTWLEQMLGLAGQSPETMPLLDSDPASLPVLVELATHDDRRVLSLTAYGIAGVIADHGEVLDTPARSSVVGSLRRLAGRRDIVGQAWSVAAQFLVSLDPEAAKELSGDR